MNKTICLFKIKNNFRKIYIFLFAALISMQLFAQPANDNCSGAIPYTPTALCNYLTYTTVGATASPGVPAPTCGNYTGGDVWFQTTVPSTGHLTFDTYTTNSSYDGSMAIYSGTCASLTQIACATGGSAYGLMPMIDNSSLTPGSTVYVRFWGGNSGADFGLCIYDPVVPSCLNNTPAGDYCSTAVPICNFNGYCGNTSATYGYTVSPTNSTDENTSPLGAIFCGSIENNSWLSFVASATTATLNVFVMNCADGYGIQMEIYSTTDCYNYTSVSNCWNPGTPVTGVISATGLTIGNTYYLMIDGQAGDICDYVISANAGVFAVSAGADVTICPGQSTTLSGSGGTNYSWSPTTNLSNPNIANPVATPAVTTTYTLTATGGSASCSGTDAVTVTVGSPTATASANSPCSGQTLNLSSTPAGGTSYTWAGPNSFSSAVQNPTITNVTPAASGIYTVTVTNNGCTASATTNVTIGSAASVTASSNSPICTGTALNLTSTAGGTSYSWTGPNGFSSAVQNPSITSATPAASGIYTVTINFAGGCTGSDTMMVVVNSSLVITPTATPAAICTGASSTLSASSTVVGSTFSWMPGSLPGTPVTVTPASTTVYTVTGTAATCTGSATVTVTVNPIPTVTAVASPASICSGASSSLSATSTVAGSTFLWMPGSMAVTPVTVSPATTTTYTVTGTAAGCTGSASVTLTVNPTPTVTVPSNIIVCNGGAIAGTTFTSSAPGTTFAWTNSNTTIGIAANGNGNIAGFTATNTTTTPVTATITVTPTANSCTGIPSSYTITVNPTPVVTVPANITVCNGAAVAGTTYTSTTPGATFTWTNSNTTIGLSANGAGNIAGFNAVNTSSAPVTATITVTPSANGCTGTSSTYTITVNPTPVVSLPANVSVCTGTAIPSATLTSTTSGAIFAWTNSNPAIGLAANGTGNIPAFTATNTNTSPIVASISVTPSANGCTGIPASYTITVNPIPVITFTAMPTLCTTSPSFTLNQASPPGGTYSGIGVVGTTFNPAVAGIGTQTITYVYTNPTTGCSNINTTQITITNGLTISVNPSDTSICHGSNVILTANGATNFIWSPSAGLNISTGPVVIANPVTSTIYTVTGSNSDGCMGVNTASVNYFDSTVVSIYAVPNNGCSPLDVTFNYTPVNIIADSTWHWNFDDTYSTNNTSNDSTGHHYYQQAGYFTPNFSAKDIYGCNISASTEVNVYVVPHADFYYNPDIGITDVQPINFADFSTNAYYWLWDFGDPESHNDNGSDLMNPSHMYADSGTYTVQLIVTTNHNCSDTAYHTVYIVPNLIFWIPNAFTPNADNKNEIFKPVILGIDRSTFQFLIYDRWGKLIFTSTNVDLGWDGKYNGKDEAEGVYSYLITFSDYNGIKHKYTGGVTLFR